MNDSPEEDELTGADQDDALLRNKFSPDWIRIPAHQQSVLWRSGISIFALFVVYLGGRSKHRRFNDRTLDHIDMFISDSIKTALHRAVFIFLSSISYPSYPKQSILRWFRPIQSFNSRRLL